MKKNIVTILTLLLVFVFILSACGPAAETTEPAQESSDQETEVQEESSVDEPEVAEEEEAADEEEQAESAEEPAESAEEEPAEVVEETPVMGGTFTRPLTTEPGSLDPHASVGSGQNVVLPLVLGVVQPQGERQLCGQRTRGQGGPSVEHGCARCRALRFMLDSGHGQTRDRREDQAAGGPTPRRPQVGGRKPDPSGAERRGLDGSEGARR